MSSNTVRETGNSTVAKEGSRTQKMVVLAVLTALVIVLEVVGAIPVGPLTFTLTLVPIVIGAILYGPAGGAFLGAVFGIVVSIQVITGAAGAFSTAMLEYAPVVTIVTCIAKGLFAGLLAGVFYKLFSKKSFYLGTIMAAIIAPVTNTGIFSVVCLTVFRGLVLSALGMSEGAGVFTAFLTGFIGVNFIIELAINVILAPVIMRIVKAARKTLH
ncbi:MAG: ECF transporter S component [Eubacteriales bacterium]|jgi:uncharacterized membrane protein